MHKPQIIFKSVFWLFNRYACPIGLHITSNLSSSGTRFHENNGLCSAENSPQTAACLSADRSVGFGRAKVSHPPATITLKRYSHAEVRVQKTNEAQRDSQGGWRLGADDRILHHARADYSRHHSRLTPAVLRRKSSQTDKTHPRTQRQRIHTTRNPHHLAEETMKNIQFPISNWTEKQTAFFFNWKLKIGNWKSNIFFINWPFRSIWLLLM